jgi:ABC-type Na+ efflux pump permease subunit
MKRKNKSKSIYTIVFVSIGLLGLILYTFGLMFNGTLCNDIQNAGLLCFGVFGLWAAGSIASVYIAQKELENL